MYATDLLTFIIPTGNALQELYEDLAVMSCAEYDLNELLSLSCSALSVRSEAPARIAEYAGQYQRLAKVGRVSEYTRDMEILSQAWLTFTSKLLALYDNANLWDERDTANFYYVRLLGSDMVVSAHPRELPR